MNLVATPIERAIALAVEAHRGQMDKSGRPYILHPLRVMLACLEHGDEVACIGILHDVVEDCEIDLELIHAEFGAFVGNGVDALTRREGETYTEFIERTCQSGEPLYIRAKLADIADNLSPARVAQLPVEMRSVSQKYEKARSILEAALRGMLGE